MVREKIEGRALSEAKKVILDFIEAALAHLLLLD